MNTLNFLDANVWLALLWRRHIHSERAQQWFEEVSEEQFFFCRFTQLTVLRLLTTEKIMANEAKTISEAWSLWEHVWADSRISYLAEPEGIEKNLRDLSQRSSRSPKVWADSYLLAFASVAGLKLVTFDRALRVGQAHVLVL